MPSVQVAADGVTVRWTAVQGATQYRIYKKQSAQAEGVAIGTTAALEWHDTDLLSNHVYYYYLTALNEAGESCRSTLQRVVTYPDSPNSVTAAPVTDSGGNIVANRIEWSSSGDKCCYIVSRSLVGSDCWEQVTTVGPDVYAFDDVGAYDAWDPDSRYVWSVLAVNETGEAPDGTVSNQSCVQHGCADLAFYSSGFALGVNDDDGDGDGIPAYNDANDPSWYAKEVVFGYGEYYSPASVTYFFDSTKVRLWAVGSAGTTEITNGVSKVGTPGSVRRTALTSWSKA